MLSSYFIKARTIAYVSLNATQVRGGSDLKRVQSFCAKYPLEVDIFAEEIHPDKLNRPLFERIRKLIESGSLCDKKSESSLTGGVL